VVYVNPFVWDRPIDDPAKIVGMDGFAREVALMLKGRTNVALFGPPDPVSHCPPRVFHCANSPASD
jgi:hypothetical protein